MTETHSLICEIVLQLCTSLGVTKSEAQVMPEEGDWAVPSQCFLSGGEKQEELLEESLRI